MGDTYHFVHLFKCLAHLEEEVFEELRLGSETTMDVQKASQVAFLTNLKRHVYFMR